MRRQGGLDMALEQPFACSYQESFDATILRDSVAPEMQTSGFPGFRNARIPDFLNSGIPDFRISEIPEFRRSRIPESRKSGIPESRNSKNQEFPSGRFCSARKVSKRIIAHTTFNVGDCSC